MKEPYHAVAVKRDRTRFHVMIQGKMIRIGGREVRVTVVRDIDAQVTAEAALKESERHLRSLMESATNFVLFRLRYHPDNPVASPNQFYQSIHHRNCRTDSGVRFPILAQADPSG
jgi:PAS domain-containing protein